MKDNRRSVVAGVGTALLTTLTGFLDIDESDSSSDGREPATDDEDVPDPTITDWTRPDPSLVWVDDEPVDDGRHEFSAEIHNAGAPGTVGVTLRWLDTPETAPSGEPATRRERFFAADERGELSITTRVPEEYGAYELQLWVSEFDVEIENDGGGGRIEVDVLENGRPIDETELPIDAGGTVSVAFDGEYADPADLEARPVS